MPFRVPGDPVWIWTCMALAIGLAAALAWRALRPARRRPLLRMACSLGAVAALLVLGLRPEVSTERTAGAAVVATPGADPARVAALADSLGAPVFALPGASGGEDAERVPDAAFLGRSHPEIGTLHIAGHGLWSYELEALQGIAVQAHLAEPSPGIQAVYAPRTAIRGQPWRVQGTLRSEAGGGWLHLSSPAGSIDSVRAVEGQTRFSLTDVPRDAGLVRYALTYVAAAGDTLAREALGVAVRTAPPLRLLVLQGAPQFETRYLKNWLAETGGVVVVRSAISRDRFRTEFVGRSEIDLAPLTPRVLDAFDVALLDARAMERLSASEQSALRAAVEESGLGVLLGPDVGALPDSRQPWGAALRWQPLGTGPREARLSWPAAPDSLAALSVAPFALDAGLGGRPLVQDAAGRTVATAAPLGDGQIGAHLPLATYRWLLGGQEQSYAAYWSHLLGALAQHADGAAWRTQTYGPLFADAPTPLAVQTPQAAPVGQAGAMGTPPDTLYLAQEAGPAPLWCGAYWPRTAGWHEAALIASGGAPADSLLFYVHSREAWQSYQQARRVAATRQAAQRSAAALSAAQTYIRYEPLPLWWFFLAFLLCAGGLWAEQRL